MPPKKTSTTGHAKQSFTSFRIIGEKAQKLLAKAKEMSKQEEKAAKNSGLPVEESPRNEMTIYLSIESVVKSTLAIFGVGLLMLILYLISDKLVLLFLALFISIVVDPGVQAMKRMGVPRSIAILLHYCVAIFLFMFLLVSLIPILADQIQQIAVLLNNQANTFIATPSVHLPLLTDQTNMRISVYLKSTLQDLSISHITDALQQLGQNLNTAAQGSLSFAAQLAGSVFGFFTKVIIVLAIAFFMQMEKEKILGWLRGFLSRNYRTYVEDKSEVIQFKIAQWARGQLLLCLSVGSLVFLALTILQVKYALTFAILAGFTEFVPVIGPLIAAVPAILVAITEKNFLWGLVIALVYYVIQWCENNLLVPLIMRRAVGLSSTAIMSAMLVGISFPAIINPLLGILLAIPSTTIIALFLEDLRDFRTQKVKREV